MRYLWGALCDRAIVDEASRKLSLIDIPNGFPVKDEPPSDRKTVLALSAVFVAAFWRGKEDEPVSEVRLSLRSPDGDREVLVVTTVGDKEKTRNSSEALLMEIQSLNVKGLGLYHIDVELKDLGSKKWRKAASCAFSIWIIPPSEAT